MYNLIKFLHKSDKPITTQDHKVSTRGSRHLNKTIPRQTKSIGQRHGNFIGPKIYNKIPISIKTLPHNDRFKHSIKRWILTTGRDYFHCVINNVYINK